MNSFRERLRRWMRPEREPALDPSDPDLRTVVSAFDETESASGALAGSTTWRAESPAVLRHHLRVSASEESRARELLEQDGWSVRHGEQDRRRRPHPDTPGGAPPDEESRDHGRRGGQRITLIAERVQHLDAVHCARENSRMVGLAQRCGGDWLGWEALQPPGTAGGRA